MRTKLFSRLACAQMKIQIKNKYSFFLKPKTFGFDFDVTELVEVMFKITTSTLTRAAARGCGVHNNNSTHNYYNNTTKSLFC